MSRGASLFAQNCAACHGPTGHGDGPGAKGISPAPRNFAQRSGWKNGTRIEDIFRTLTQGLQGTSMVSYSQLTETDRIALAHTVQGLGAFDHGASDPAARAALQDLFRTAGEVIPNRIPVHAAMDALCREFQPAPCSIQGVHSDSMLREAIEDPARAAQTLGAVAGWDTDLGALARAVVGGNFDNGFFPIVATYSDADWKQLQKRLARR